MASRQQPDAYMDEWWDLSTAGLAYRGDPSQLPAFLPHFTIPLPKAWFGALFRQCKRKHEVVYRNDAYRVAAGSTAYSRRQAYRDSQWLPALRRGFFAVQVEWAETTDGLPQARRPGAALQVSILIPNAQRSHLEKYRTVTTT